MTTRFGLFLPVALTAALAIAGCGSGAGKADSSASGRPNMTDLRNDLTASLKNAVSVRISGAVPQGSRSIAVNMIMTKSGESSGSVSANHMTISELTTSHHTYFKITADFLRSAKLPATVCAQVCGKWVEVPAGEEKSLMGGLTLGNFIGKLTKGTPTFRYGGTATIHGQAAWLLHVSDGTTAYAAAQGTHYLLRLVAQHRSEGQIDFTQWNSATIPSPPPASKVISINQLMNS